jgi:large subunit ribosomal protein L35Ae
MAMKAVISNFRMSRHTTTGNQMILELEGVKTRADAEKVVGKTVSWKSPAAKEIKGKVASAHGNSGAVRVIFETGMPGQAIGTKVELQ